ncbi:Replication factor A protein 2 [Coemansia sp. RSA 922]|nr:Replication factor A protein 2 [Coemansia sp. S100]KAJ2114467.1 Replication factor A protein 2 [Coemansia sp. RSA 922]
MSFGGGYNQQGGGQEFSYGGNDGGGNKSSGGGWMNSSTGGGGDEDNKTRGGYKNQTLRPVTIKQLIEVPATTADAPIVIDGGEVKNITFVGVVRSVLQQPINIIYSIEDGTGKIDVRVWTGGNDQGGDMGDDGQEVSNQMADPNITVGKYVRVYGELRFFNGKRNVSSHKVRLVTDHNEIAYHGMEAIYVHLNKTRGPPPALGQHAAQGAGQGSGVGSSSVYSSGGAVGGYGGMGGNNQGLTPIQAAILDVITASPPGSEGLEIAVIKQRLTGRYPSNQIADTVEWLICEGHLYNTIDENHVQSTSMSG